jgi:Aldehyde dehydrogenase family
VPGFGETSGRALGRHLDVDVISFTGSGEVGKLFLRYSGESNMKAVWLECGGKSPNVVLADAPSLETAAQTIAEGVFVNAGQMCNAGSRVLVEKTIADELVERIVEAAEPWKPVHPFQPEAKMGAIVDDTQLERVLGYIEAGKQEAELVTGGNRALEETGGLYVEPTIFTDATHRRRWRARRSSAPSLRSFRSRMSSGAFGSRTTRRTGSRRPSGRATSAARSASRGNCGRATSTSTRTTAATSRCRSRRSSSRGSGSTSRSTPISGAF